MGGQKVLLEAVPGGIEGFYQCGELHKGPQGRYFKEYKKHKESERR